ncbi:unnamed protein product, partial [Polarella glacialis]
TPSAVAARRPWLIKLHDVVAHLQVHDPKAAKVVPALWREAASQAARLEAERLGASPVHKQVQAIVQRLGVNSSCCTAGAFTVDFLDEESRLVLDIELVSWPVTCRVRHDVLRQIGYKPARLEYWDWKALRSSGDREAFLVRLLAAAKLSPEVVDEKR